ncbi:M23 family metallopeptidase [Sphingobium olei]|uniref:M23 family metallopeptidase n=1 Tax=Sphingobium olei TaxID=420955 RepID=A0ABW3P4X2_9SPHN|nr:M23 family metallopeptidase [Sphingobium sp.]
MRTAVLAVSIALASVAVAQPAAPISHDFGLNGAPMQGAVLRGVAPPNTVSLTLDGKPVAVDTDGRFLIAFDRDAAPTALLTARLGGGRVLSQSLAVAPREWRIERVDAPLRPTTSSEAFLALRRPELEAIAEARAKVTDAKGWRQSFIWPRIGRISGLFGSQRIYRGEPGAFHGGVDIAGATGDPVVAPADGVVILAASEKPYTLEGHLLMIDHGHGLNSAFLHLSRIDVRLGEAVRQGQRIGAVGATGRATGPHLHWGMKWNDARIDPMLIAGPMPQGR